MVKAYLLLLCYSMTHSLVPEVPEVTDNYRSYRPTCNYSLSNYSCSYRQQKL
jgi:hypothetical protein